MPKRSMNPIDAHVGGRVRLRRMLIGMSQERLGELLGVTFQQVQKYEKGANRVGASRLFEIAEVLDVPVQFFFDDLPGIAERQRGFSDGASEPYVMDFVSSAEGLALNRAFAKIRDTRLRKRIVDLVREMAGDGTGD
jgi:transcriptional regulator with XRE-family HTH domain